MLLATLTLLLAPISVCEVAPVNPLAGIADIVSCPSDGADFYEVLDLNSDLTEAAHSGHGDVRLVVTRTTPGVPDGAINWPEQKPRTTVTFYDRHLFTWGSGGPMNGSAVVNEDGTFEIWVPARRDGGYKERSVLITGRVVGNSIVIEEYRYRDDFVPENSSGTIHKSRREYKKGPVAFCAG